MAILNIFTFLCSISVTALILPSMVPNFSLMLVGLLLVVLLLNFLRLNHIDNSTFNKNLYPVNNINYHNFFIPFFALSLLFVWISILSFYEGANIYAYFGTLLIHILFLFFIMNTKGFINSYIKSYVYFVFLMSLLGIFADFLLAFNIIDISTHYVNLNEITNGSFTRDEAMGADSYAFPYGLGMILTGSGKLDLLGFEFYRISGWAHEPTSATLFISPALILLFHGGVIKKQFIRIVMIATIGIFWLLAMSVGSLLAFILLYFIVIYSTIYSKYFPLKMSLFTFISMIIFIMFILLSIDSITQSSIFTTKFNLESETMRQAINEILWFMPDHKQTTLFYFSHLVLWSIILSFMLLLGSVVFSKVGLNEYLLILLYMIIHSMKGSQENVFMLVFSFFWFYLAYFSVQNTGSKFCLLNSLGGKKNE